MLKGYKVICWNAEGVHGKRKVGKPWFILTFEKWFKRAFVRVWSKLSSSLQNGTCFHFTRRATPSKRSRCSRSFCYSVRWKSFYEIITKIAYGWNAHLDYVDWNNQSQFISSRKEVKIYDLDLPKLPPGTVEKHWNRNTGSFIFPQRIVIALRSTWYSIICSSFSGAAENFSKHLILLVSNHGLEKRCVTMNDVTHKHQIICDLLEIS